MITVEYWAKSSDAKTTKITLSANAKYYVNGALITYIPNLLNFYGSVTFVKNDTNKRCRFSQSCK